MGWVHGGTRKTRIMSIFKIRNKRAPIIPRKLVGAYLSQRVNSYLSLYALSKGITKSTVIRNQIEEWHRAESIMYPTEKLVEIIIDKIKPIWKLRKKSPCSTSDLNLFRRNLKIELIKKGINEVDIIVILTALK